MRDRGPRVNERIRFPQVRVVADDGEQLGILRIEEAIATAAERGLDLVEVAPDARPPVCRIMDYGRFKYDKKRREKENRKKQHVIQTKEVRIRPKTDEHDFQVKLKRARGFLEKNFRVLVSVLFRGRERAHGDIARSHLDRMVTELEDIAKVDVPPKMEGYRMTMILARKSTK